MAEAHARAHSRAHTQTLTVHVRLDPLYSTVATVVENLS